MCFYLIECRVNWNGRSQPHIPPSSPAWRAEQYRRFTTFRINHKTIATPASAPMLGSSFDWIGGISRLRLTAGPITPYLVNVGRITYKATKSTLGIIPLSHFPSTHQWERASVLTAAVESFCHVRVGYKYLLSMVVARVHPPHQQPWFLHVTTVITQSS